MTRLELIITELQCAARDHDHYEAAKIISEAFTESCCKETLFCLQGNCLLCLTKYLQKNIKGGK